jgi:flagellar hook protein FlgE
MQIGRGSLVGSINNLFVQGSMETTNNPTDIGIAGEGFFILRYGNEQFFTRDGSFDVDADGTLVDPSTGYAVQGRMANDSGQILSSTPISDIILPTSSMFPASASTTVGFSGNLDATAGVADTGSDGIDDISEAYQTSVLVYDSLGDTHTITMTFGLTDTANEWTWEAALAAGDTNVISAPSPVSGLLHFNADGSIDAVTTPAEVAVDITLSGSAGAGNPLDNGAAEQTITLNFEELVQFSGAFSPVPSSRDGYGVGALVSVNFDNTGTLIGTFSNGATQRLAQVALADFYNPAGLIKSGSNLYSVSMNSGAPIVGTAGGSIRAAIMPGTLESSNVDLANEFTRMIIAQRGFEANSRVVMTSDSILGDLINLKR